jgi:uridine kinase
MGAGAHQDSFYRQHTQEEIDLAFRSELDLDHPNAIDTDLFVEVGGLSENARSKTVLNGDVLCSVCLV